MLSWNIIQQNSSVILNRWTDGQVYLCMPLTFLCVRAINTLIWFRIFCADQFKNLSSPDPHHTHVHSPGPINCYRYFLTRPSQITLIVIKSWKHRHPKGSFKIYNVNKVQNIQVRLLTYYSFILKKEIPFFKTMVCAAYVSLVSFPCERDR